MKHPCIEFITACSCCAVFADFVKSLAPEYPGVEVKLYEAGKDTDYIPKYGAVTKSVLIVNESRAVTELSKSSIREAFESASKNV
ncbi:MAG: thioredoxin-like (seleno)protein SaoT [Pyramidobacter sp.]|jgi:hypothetical protein